MTLGASVGNRLGASGGSVTAGREHGLLARLARITSQE